MPKDTFKYSNGEVTIVWKPDVCIHSGICVKGLPLVFNAQRKPWIDAGAATTNQIIEQVRKCPSGALSYFLNNSGEEGQAETGIVAEAAKMTMVEVSSNGPYIIRTECVIKHSDGHEETRKGKVVLCRCGSSQTKPYCDGSHKRIGFQE